jgi:hypothetical protein
MPAMAVRRHGRGARGVSVERVMVAPSETSWTSKAASQCGAADMGENAPDRVNVPSVQRLNRCHVD